MTTRRDASLLATFVLGTMGAVTELAAGPATARSFGTSRIAARTLTGGTAKTRSAGAEAAARALLDLVKQENALALAARTPRRAGAPASPTPKRMTAGSLRQGSIVASLESDGIHTVNNKGTGFIVSPGVYLTIKGHGFGDVMGTGKANVIGEMPGGAAPLTLIDWRDDEIDTLLPPGLRGVPDQIVFVQVITGAGKTYKLGGGRYVATREETVVTTNIGRFVTLKSPMPYFGSPVSLSGDGSVQRYWDSPIAVEMNAGCGGDLDDLQTINRNGFIVVGLDAEWGRSDSGDRDASGGPGFRKFTGRYAFGPWDAYHASGDEIRIAWGAWWNHSSSPPKGSAAEECLSTYQLAVHLLGPAGVSPF
jgi:hypothetical protein